jgi:hypothetical protein
MRIVTLFILFVLSSQIITAQNKISGKVVDSMNRLPLPDATVTIINPVDSAAVGFAVVDKTGLFEIKNLAKGNYVLGITYTGYSPFKKNLEITQTQFTIDLDTVLMSLDNNMLGSVVVQAPPITVKKDTIEFRASSFKTKPNATVEDLLKKLPGVEVDKEGNITSQGEEITKIYVDGKEFFLNDPKLATKNLSSEMVEAVQVFDDMSDQAKFTKIDDGSRKRTINIRLKKDRKKGVFGRTSASIGTSDRYEGSASFNAFNNDQQISILGGANNINRLGFTNNDLISAMGGMGGGGNRGGGGGRGGRGGGGNAPAANNGNTKSWSTGINYRDEWGHKVDFSGSYFVSQTDNSNYSESYRQNLFSNDSVAYVNSVSNTKNSNINHRLGFRLEYMIDSMNSLLITPTLNLQQGQSANDNSLVTRATNPRLDYKAIEGESHSNSKRDGQSFNNDLLFRHRFNKPGRTFTLGWSSALNNSNGHGFNYSPYHFYDSNNVETRFDNRDQRNDQLTRSFNNTISSSVTEMLDSSMVWELNYAYTINRSNSDRDTYDYNALTSEYDSINKAQTNYFENLFTANRLGTNFRVKKQKYDYQFGGAVNFASLENLSDRATTGKATMRQTYTNLFPNASFNFNPKPRKNLRFNYRGSTRAPSISQLQDFQDISNRLNIRTGNPDLKQEFTHNVTINYSTFNLTNFLYLNISSGANFISNKIVNSTSKLDEGVLLTRPENLNGAQSYNASGTIGIPLKKVTTGRRSPVNLNLTTTGRYNRDVSKLQDTVRFNYTKVLGQRVSFNYFIQDKLDLQANANFNYNDARYSLQQAQNYKYFNQHYSIDVTYTLFKRIMINNDFDFYVNTGRADGFNQSIPLWNAYVSCLLFKKQNGELRISGVDLLNQNKSINRTAGETYIDDTYTRVLQRFFLVSFMYNFKNFGKGMFPGRENRERSGRRYSS